MFLVETQRRRGEKADSTQYQNRLKRQIVHFCLQREEYQCLKYCPLKVFFTLNVANSEVTRYMSGTACKKSERALKTKLADEYPARLAERTRSIHRRVMNGEPILICLWADDYTRFWYNSQFVHASNSQDHAYWTPCAIKASLIEGSHGPAKVPKDGTPQLYNPHGYSYKTSMEIMKTACPGRPSFMEDFIELMKRTYDSETIPGLKVNKAMDKVSSVASVRKRARTLHYDQASSNDKHAAMDGVLLIDIMTQNYKSYPEFARAILRLISEPGVFALLDDGVFIPLPLDWPAREFTEAIFARSCS